jgi:hypothetical protein
MKHKTAIFSLPVGAEQGVTSKFNIDQQIKGLFTQSDCNIQWISRRAPLSDVAQTGSTLFFVARNLSRCVVNRPQTQNRNGLSFERGSLRHVCEIRFPRRVDQPDFRPQSCQHVFLIGGDGVRRIGGVAVVKVVVCSRFYETVSAEIYVWNLT